MQPRSVVSNKCPWNSDRGYGKDAASFLMERVMDHIAKTARLERTAIRFKNFIQPEEFPVHARLVPSWTAAIVPAPADAVSPVTRQIVPEEELCSRHL